MKSVYLLSIAALLSMNAYADDSSVDAAVGGAIGGAVGAAVGNEIGGREGAIIGGGLGGATGAAVATDGDGEHHYREGDHHDGHSDRVYIEPSHGHDFCPPGQAKKGNC